MQNNKLERKTEKKEKRQREERERERERGRKKKKNVEIRLCSPTADYRILLLNPIMRLWPKNIPELGRRKKGYLIRSLI